MHACMHVCMYQVVVCQSPESICARIADLIHAVGEEAEQFFEAELVHGRLAGVVVVVHELCRQRASLFCLLDDHGVENELLPRS